MACGRRGFLKVLYIIDFISKALTFQNVCARRGWLHMLAGNALISQSTLDSDFVW